jgi:hypothetical protein
LFRVFITHGLVWLTALVVVIGAIAFAGYLQPQSHWATLLRLNECELPCWIGIEPGETTFAEAERRIRDAYADRSHYRLETQQINRFRVTYQPSGQSIDVALDQGLAPETPQDVVQRIRLWLGTAPDFPPELWELFRSLGNPQTLRAIVPGINRPSLIIIYTDQHVGVFLDALNCYQVLPGQRIRQIVLDPHPESVIYLAAVSEPLYWRGFGRCHSF